MQPLVLLQKAKVRECSLRRRCAASCTVHLVCTGTQTSGNSLFITQKITQNTRKKKKALHFFTVRVISTGRRHAGKLWSLCLWRYSKPSMTWLWAVELDKMICSGVTSVDLSSHWEKLQTVGSNCIPNFQILSMWHPASDLTALWLALRTTQFWIQKAVVISSSFSRAATGALTVTAGKYTCGGWRNCSVIQACADVNTHLKHYHQDIRSWTGS